MKLNDENSSVAISIIIPIYNTEMYLTRCIESVETQTFKEWELILIDDGSTDDSLQLCEKFAQKDNRIRVIHTENLGVSMARNLGINEANGKCITFIDADDWVDTAFLEILWNNLQPADDVIGCRLRRSKGDFKVEKKGYSGDSWISTGEEWIKEILQGNTRCVTKMYRREYLEGVCFKSELSIGEDMFFLLELAHKGGTIRNLDYEGYIYYFNPESAMNRDICDSYLDQIKCWRYAYSTVQEDTEEIRRIAGKEVLVAVIQVLDKLARLDFKERRYYKEYVEQCRKACKTFQRYLPELRRNHQLKIILFLGAPRIFWLLDGIYQQKENVNE